ncbi:MAG: hypothetical protein LBD58_08230 [Treponema sp.]|jgi:hypothetical protein|nr:hypothetical protein [Treponema sp.]
MTEHQGYLPQDEAGLVDWGDNFVDKVDKNAVAWEIPQAEADDLKTKLAAFKTLRAQCAGPDRTKTLVAEKNEAKNNFRAAVRTMVKFRFANPIITDAIRVQCGLPPKDHTRTAIGVPTTRPEFDLKVKDIRQIAVDFWDQGATSKAKPYGTNGAVISWGIFDRAPADSRELNKSTLATRTPFTLEFAEEERGKTVYIALQWQNESGKRGRSSEMLSTIIP